MELNQHIIFYVTPSLEGGYYFEWKLYVKAMRSHMWSPFLVDVWVWYLHYHAYLTSHHVSRELCYELSMQSITYIHHPLGFHCIPCISSHLGDDAIMPPQHLNCVSGFEWVLGSLRAKANGGVVKCDEILSDILILY